MPAPTPDDLIDRVDLDDNVVGTIKRRDVFAAHAGFRVVHVLVTNDHGDILLQQVGDVGTRSPGKWGSSVAGYLHAGEDPLGAAHRRMLEEIGLQSTLTFAGRAVMEDEGSHKHIYAYRAQAEHATLRDDRHIKRLQFWPTDEVRRVMDETPEVFTSTFEVVFRAFDGRV